MEMTVKGVADLLKGAKDVLILCHQSPDGDTLGSGYGLYFCLKKLGVRARVLCPDEIPELFKFLLRGYREETFDPALVVAVDIADAKLMGRLCQQYGDSVDLCIDHHISNTGYARRLLLDREAAGTAEVIFALAKEWGLTPDPHLADCLYTGIATDSGCFKYQNTTPRTHRIAAELMEWGAAAAEINRAIFDTKSQGRLAAESALIRSIRYFCGGRLAVAVMDLATIAETGAGPADFDGLTALPRQVEGVEIGITLREREPGFQGERAHLQLCGRLGPGGPSGRGRPHPRRGLHRPRYGGRGGGGHPPTGKGVFALDGRDFVRRQAGGVHLL